MSYDAWIRALNRNGQGYYVTANATTGTATAIFSCALSLFNPSNSGKTLYIYSFHIGTNTTSGGGSVISLTTTDPSGGSGFTNIPTIQKYPSVIAGPASVASASSTPTGNAATVGIPGTRIDTVIIGTAGPVEWLTNGAELLLPPGNGFSVMIATALTSAAYEAMARWVEV